ncbi:efflux transporter outer membrane subunit [Ferrimonas gelatinilytica]|uniref:AdeC/AdeK/OprM family multidrug efflux complex outer membrane factor n=1 Tax=Ferrimonas gelatinilytica TaxID=1255257 RepID=A0ABP9RV86_9GAMM
MKRWLVIAGSALLTGCMNLAPDYERPEGAMPEFWAEPSAMPSEISSAALDWRSFIVDPKLQRLIEIALEHNRDIKVASETLRQAAALYGVQRSERFPNLDLTAGFINQRVPEALSGVPDSVNRQHSIDLGLLSYELDFWGRVASLERQALNAYLATEQGRRNIQIIVINQVAATFLQLAADEALLLLAEETMESQMASLALTQQSFDNGVVSGLDVAQAEVTVAIARVDVANYSNRVAAGVNALVSLVGTGFDPVLLPEPGQMEVLAPVQVGLPSMLLTQRPDVAQAEYNLIAANASIGAARAAYFPNISLTATAGLLSADLDDLFSGDAGSWNFTPSLYLPIFNWGRVRGNVEVAKAQAAIALAQYERTIQIAFQEVSDALSGQRYLAQQYEAQSQLVDATGTSFSLSDLRFRQGVDSFFTVLDSQRGYYSAQQGLINLALVQQNNRLNLFRALGGGWVGSPTADEIPPRSD